ncbi:hypothetical protein F5Y16DRAFT_419504 [Xylariaceae sp. FL0255]|nr:hypothetical protein F5Y16DRAFT_419504 [Xylariaceae sp. FL0255]
MNYIDTHAPELLCNGDIWAPADQLCHEIHPQTATILENESLGFILYMNTDIEQEFNDDLISESNVGGLTPEQDQAALPCFQLRDPYATTSSKDESVTDTAGVPVGATSLAYWHPPLTLSGPLAAIRYQSPQSTELLDSWTLQDTGSTIWTQPHSFATAEPAKYDESDRGTIKTHSPSEVSTAHNLHSRTSASESTVPVSLESALAGLVKLEDSLQVNVKREIKKMQESYAPIRRGW